MMSDIWAACPWSSATVPMVATFMPLESPSTPAVGPGKLNSLHGDMWGEACLFPLPLLLMDFPTAPALGDCGSAKTYHAPAPALCKAGPTSSPLMRNSTMCMETAVTS